MDNSIELTPEEIIELDASLTKIPLLPGGRRWTLEELLFRWNRLISHIEAGYNFTIDDYTNDLCIRDFLQTIVNNCTCKLQDKVLYTLAPLDDRYISSTDSVDEPLLPSLDGPPGWWWYRFPKKHSDRFYLL